MVRVRKDVPATLRRFFFRLDGQLPAASVDITVRPVTSPNDYRLAALERIIEADALRRAGTLVMSMYISGVAAECMLRAYRKAGRLFDERHDLIELLRSCDLERLGVAGFRRLREPVQLAHLLWWSGLRFAHEGMARQRLRRMRAVAGRLPRAADFLKVRCNQLGEACREIVDVGAERWTT